MRKRNNMHKNYVFYRETQSKISWDLCRLKISRRIAWWKAINCKVISFDFKLDNPANNVSNCSETVNTVQRMHSSNAVQCCRDDFPNSNLVQQRRDFILRGLITASVVIIELINAIIGDKTNIKCNKNRIRMNGTINAKKERGTATNADIPSSQCICEGNCQIALVKMLIIKLKLIICSVLFHHCRFKDSHLFVPWLPTFSLPQCGGRNIWAQKISSGCVRSKISVRTAFRGCLWSQQRY